MNQFTLEVTGDYACFTRPEFKVERVSYDVMTPSVARSIFEAILWKPEIHWEIRTIKVLNPIRWMTIKRNEVDKRATPRNRGMDILTSHMQRTSLVLRDVRYQITGQMYVHSTDPAQEIKYNTIFQRRAEAGQCFNQPYLGCREFSASFRLVSSDEVCIPIQDNRELGYMFYDWDYTNPQDPRPILFKAQMVNGVIEVPDMRVSK